MKKCIKFIILFILLALLFFLGREKISAFYYNQGCKFYEANSPKNAITSFKNSLLLKPSQSRTHYSLANAYYLDGQKEKAVGEYKKAILSDKHFLWAYEALADIYLRGKDYENAFSVLKQASSNLPDSQQVKDFTNLASFEYAADLIDKGIRAFSAGDKLKGYELLGKAVEVNPNFAVSFYTLGLFYYSENRLEEAYNMLIEASRLDDKFALPHKLLGNIYFEKRFFSKAIQEYQKFLSLGNNDPEILNNLGLAFMNLEDYHQAAVFLEKAAALSPESINIQYSLASVYRDGAKLEQAASEYKKIIQSTPDYPNIHNDLADIYKKQGDTTKAAEEYQKEIDVGRKRLEAAPSEPAVLNNISYAYNGLGQHDKAKEMINKALAINPNYREAHLTLAAIQRNLGEYKEAFSSLKDADKLYGQKQNFIEQRAMDIREELAGVLQNETKFEPKDTVYLKNGRKVEGMIIRQDNDYLILKINIGSSIGDITLLKENIEQVVTKK